MINIKSELNITSPHTIYKSMSSSCLCSGRWGFCLQWLLSEHLQELEVLSPQVFSLYTLVHWLLMDPIASQKPRAMKSSKKRSRFQSIYNLILQLLIALACALISSHSVWFPSVKQFLFVSLPNASSYVLSPKCLFVVVNVIVIALIGESKLGGSMKPSPSCEIYDDYVKRSQRSVPRHPVSSIRKEVEVGKRFPGVDGEKRAVYMTKVVAEPARRRRGNQRVKDEGDQEEEEDELPNEELNRRVDEFIARVNRQWWLEARSLMNIPTQHVGRNIAVHG